MSNIKNLTDDQIRELLLRPFSDEDSKRLSEIDKADSWLLALNFEEMDRRDADPNYDPANDPTCVLVTTENDED